MRSFFLQYVNFSSRNACIDTWNGLGRLNMHLLRTSHQVSSRNQRNSCTTISVRSYGFIWLSSRRDLADAVGTRNYFQAYLWTHQGQRRITMAICHSFPPNVAIFSFHLVPWRLRKRHWQSWAFVDS
jgi:hypothetical protein